eukprot:CAMPEP_0176270024 /NCGR_PEP_ID=MMETSP0121_2-20121125/44490_1 /TAXON_ID=160619 /ORGANISM="Kryptoperidinium foliaceum, Strain CCMP 1326" /LENGTH=125 /DNA_ID=CAMNT_0017610163 /DNA_START=16 /DNA_END=393 /DNA_ORIENTATION=+
MAEEYAAAAPPVPADGAPPAFPSQYDESGQTSFDKVEADLRGAPLRIICQMPDGSMQEVACNMGHDVMYAKGQLSRKTEIDFGRLKLFMGGKLMFDPLSFNDFPDIVNSPTKEIQVQVTVDPEQA